MGIKMTTIDAKWKAFTINLHFAFFAGDICAFYDQLTESMDEDAYVLVMEKFKAGLWYPFRGMRWDQAIRSVEDAALDAQHTDVYV